MRILVPAFVLILAGCGPGLESQISTARSNLDNAKNALSETESTCESNTTAFVGTAREILLAEADAAIAENNANAGPGQEWELRRSLGRELGLAPNEVKAWREVYKGRAESAKRDLARFKQPDKHQEMVNKAQKEYACGELAAAKFAVKENKRILALLKSQRPR